MVSVIVWMLDTKALYVVWILCGEYCMWCGYCVVNIACGYGVGGRPRGVIVYLCVSMCMLCIIVCVCVGAFLLVIAFKQI